MFELVMHWTEEGQGGDFTKDACMTDIVQNLNLHAIYSDEYYWMTIPPHLLATDHLHNLDYTESGTHVATCALLWYLTSSKSLKKYGISLSWMPDIVNWDNGVWWKAFFVRSRDI